MNQNNKNRFFVKPCTVAAFIVAEVIQNQAENNHCVMFDKIEETFPSLQSTGWRDCSLYLDAIIDCLFDYPQFRGGEASMVEVEDDCFNCVAFTDYIACEPCDGDEHDDDFDEDWERSWGPKSDDDDAE